MITRLTPREPEALDPEIPESDAAMAMVLLNSHGQLRALGKALPSCKLVRKIQAVLQDAFQFS